MCSTHLKVKPSVRIDSIETDTSAITKQELIKNECFKGIDKKGSLYEPRNEAEARVSFVITNTNLDKQDLEIESPARLCSQTVTERVLPSSEGIATLL